jgi:hypothetical protein
MNGGLIWHLTLPPAHPSCLQSIVAQAACNQLWRPSETENVRQFGLDAFLQNSFLCLQPVSNADADSLLSPPPPQVTNRKSTNWEKSPKVSKKRAQNALKWLVWATFVPFCAVWVSKVFFVPINLLVFPIPSISHYGHVYVLNCMVKFL